MNHTPVFEEAVSSARFFMDKPTVAASTERLRSTLFALIVLIVLTALAVIVIY